MGQRRLGRSSFSQVVFTSDAAPSLPDTLQHRSCPTESLAMLLTDRPELLLMLLHQSRRRRRPSGSPQLQPRSTTNRSDPRGLEDSGAREVREMKRSQFFERQTPPLERARTGWEEEGGAVVVERQEGELDNAPELMQRRAREGPTRQSPSSQPPALCSQVDQDRRWW